jgi:hypothetical protein
VNVPQINIGSTGRATIHISQVVALPSNTPWGNLLLKSLKIVSRLEYVNQKLALIYRRFEEQKNPQGFSIDLCVLESEEVIYWIRKSVDEIIQLLYVGYYLKQTGSYPKEIKIDSIGGLLEQKDTGFYDLFADEYAKLGQLNDVSNAYKHSFVNSNSNLTGRDEPVVFSLSVVRNNLRNPAQFNAIALSDFINHFDQLYVFYKTKCLEFFGQAK